MDAMAAPSDNFAQAYHLEKVISWLDRGGNVNETRLSKKGHTLLISASIQNHEKAVAELLRRGADPNIKGGGKTALVHAVAMANRGCVELLLRGGARTDIRVDVDDSDYTENDGMSPLEIVEAELAGRGARPRMADIGRMLRAAEAEQQRHR